MNNVCSEVMDVPAFPTFRRIVVMLLALVMLAALAAPALADGAVSGTAVTGAVLDSDGNPIPGAMVELLRQGAGVVDSGKTDSDGHYALATGSAAGLDFRLRVWASGFATAEQTWVPSVDGSRVDFRLAALGATLAGTVLDGNANPVAGAQVQVYRKGAGLAASTTSAADGSYRVTGLRAGDSYQVQVLRPGYGVFQQSLAALAAGATLRLDPVITAATAALSGQVVDGQSGKPVVGARVEVLRNSFGLLVEGSTDAGGNFSYTLPADAAPSYQLRVFADGYAAYASARFALPGGSVRDLAGADQIVLSPAFGSVVGFVFDANGRPRDGVSIHLDKQGLGTIASTTTDSTGWYAISNVPASTDPAYRIRLLSGAIDNPIATDTAWFSLAPGAQYEADVSLDFKSGNAGYNGTISGRVVDEAGRALAGVTVQAVRAYNPVITYSATTDQSGHYRIDLPGNKISTSANSPGYILTASADGFFANDQPQVTLPPVTTPSPSFGPAPTPTAAWVDVTPNKVTTASFTLHASKGRLSGRALDAQGRPIPGAKVNLLREGKGIVQSKTTDPAGRYSFDGIEVVGRPSYLVEVAADGYLPSALGKDGSGNWLVDAAGGLGAIQDVRLLATSASLAGSVVDASGRAVARATVIAWDRTSDKYYKAMTGPDGTYTLSGLPAGGQSYSITVSAEQMQDSALTRSGDLAAPIAPNPGDRLSADLLLVPAGAALTGTVYGVDGGLVPGAQVELWQEGVGPVASTKADASGQYRFDQLVPGGRYAVRASAAGYRPSSLKYGLDYVPGLISVEGGDRATWNIVLYR